ncbi:MAG: AraC family transcriptional regulator [Pseudomonadota bacterium]
MQTELPDLDELTGLAGPGISVDFEQANISPQLYFEMTRDVWHMVQLRQKGGYESITADIWNVGDWFIAHNTLPAFLTRMERCHLQDVGAFVNFERAFGGGDTCFIYEDGEVYKTGPGQIDSFDRSRSYQCVSPSETSEVVSFPRELIGLPTDVHVPIPAIHATTSIGQIIHSELDDVFASLKRGQAALPQIKLDRLAACFKIALGANPQREDVRAHARQALFRQVCLFIERNLERVELSTATLLDQFCLSRATLYRMFEPLGGVRNYLMYRRAMAALFDLADAKAERGSVLRVCERWNFSSPANFNRSIQRLFGNSPRALIGKRTSGTSATPTSPFKLDYVSSIYDLEDSDDLEAVAA